MCGIPLVYLSIFCFSYIISFISNINKNKTKLKKICQGKTSFINSNTKDKTGMCFALNVIMIYYQHSKVQQQVSTHTIHRVK